MPLCPEFGARGRRARALRSVPLLLSVLTLLGIAFTVSFSPAGGTSVHGATASLPAAQNSSSGSDPSGSNGVVCPSAGPVILGVQWNCVAILDLTELVLILVSIGIVAYVFKDSDRAELPGESAVVPVTAEEWDAYRRARKLGVPYEPPRSPMGEEEK
jgi:hypothetical protein